MNPNHESFDSINKQTWPPSFRSQSFRVLESRTNYHSGPEKFNNFINNIFCNKNYIEYFKNENNKISINFNEK